MVRKNVAFIVMVACFFTFLFWSQVKLSMRTVQDNDEGIYLTTLLLISNGHPAYKDTFLSQPPFFFMSVNPLFSLLGKTLPAARIAVGLLSLAGLAAILWIGCELDRKWSGLFAAGLLYLIPHYARETLIFQSDSIATAFSLMSLALFISFFKRGSIVWFIASVITLNLAFWSKLDITLIPAFIGGLAIHFRKRSLLLLTIGIIISLSIFFIFIAPFGIVHIYNNVVRLRLQASSLSQSPLRLVELLFPDPLLFLVVIAAILMPFVKTRQHQPYLGVMTLWNYATLGLIAGYRPLFDHHLLMLSVPAVIVTSTFLYDILYRKYKMLSPFFSAVVVFIAVLSRLALVANTRDLGLTVSQRQAVTCIKNNTNPKDLIVSDEEILMPASGRLPPPPLADVSYIRILSGNLTSSRFRQILDQYHPKMVIAWNGRLASLKHLDSLLHGYARVSCTGLKEQQRIYLKK